MNVFGLFYLKNDVSQYYGMTVQWGPCKVFTHSNGPQNVLRVRGWGWWRL